ncbi:hypothetical protein J2Y48_000350 [Mycoplana sp. BE70]|nr:hypothetical protein [Mycoplana sp. BE70]
MRKGRRNGFGKGRKLPTRGSRFGYKVPRVNCPLGR